jgi:hypothetical protein
MKKRKQKTQIKIGTFMVIKIDEYTIYGRVAAGYLCGRTEEVQLANNKIK